MTQSNSILTSVVSQFTVKRSTFSYLGIIKYLDNGDRKVELPEGERDLKSFLLNIIKNEVSEERVITEFLNKNTKTSKPFNLDILVFQEPEVELNEEEHITDYEIHTYYYEGKIQSICNALLQGAIKHLESF